MPTKQVFVWCSKNTMESAQALATKLGCEFGTIPPKNFAGRIINYGAAPSEAFKWDSRTGPIVNDPRKYRKFSHEEKLHDGKLLRVFVVGGKVVKAVYTDTAETGTPELTKTLVDCISSSIKTLAQPDFVALDIAYDVVQHQALVLRTLFGPAIVGHPEVVDAIAAHAGGKETAKPQAPGKTDKDVLMDMIKNASHEEASALRKLLKSVANA